MDIDDANTALGDIGKYCNEKLNGGGLKEVEVTLNDGVTKA
jgi:hypothetical protein